MTGSFIWGLASEVQCTYEPYQPRNILARVGLGVGRRAGDMGVT